ncbi:hypothetical protein K443DRAFT_2613 [Laccaria amethystina LaAM-08-1]|uniref:Uncharacterized protein n=1 Tax=Laccaria amethystina LaAM-08-1 TaxID=1095629 RepID=A0A0C9YA68_9AGAR|nr:hypothetical protein K443DRAFT_2613 [Laccaria amethystina LaAM-08-1]
MSSIGNFIALLALCNLATACIISCKVSDGIVVLTVWVVSEGNLLPLELISSIICHNDEGPLGGDTTQDICTNNHLIELEKLGVKQE